MDRFTKKTFLVNGLNLFSLYELFCDFIYSICLKGGNKNNN